jgi:small GTP-binding protein
MNNSCKIVLVGDAGSGKTCIIHRYVNNKFEKSQMTTACPSVCTKTISYPEYNKTINFDIWDTAGQEIYRSISKLFYKGASIGFLVYDVTNKNSFKSIKDYWYNQLKENTESDIIFNIVGNKIDLYELEQVTEEEGKNFAKSINAGFYLTSAKNNVRISELFLESGKKFIDPNFNSELNKNNDEKRARKYSIKIKAVPKQDNNICC